MLYGFTDISFSDFRADYKNAIIFAVPYSEMLSINDYTEEKFEFLIGEARETVHLILSELSGLLLAHQIKYCIPPVAQTSEEALLAPFSFKFAAYHAGLGWIGKNDVLITKEYGPRVRLSAILIDQDLPSGVPVNHTCAENCRACVIACPYQALTGRQWDRDIKRIELIDYQMCNKKRSGYLKTHNRKNACGFCMAACPYGLTQSKKT